MARLLIKNEKFPRFVIFAGMAFSLLAIWIIFAVDLRSSRYQQAASVRQELLFRTRALAAHNSNMIGSSEMILTSVTRWISLHPGADPLHQPDFLNLIRSFENYDAIHPDLRLADSTGRLWFPDSARNNPAVNVSDREYFKVQMDSRTAGFYIGRTVKSRDTAVWGIPLSVPAGINPGKIAAVFMFYETDQWQHLFRNTQSQNDQSFMIRSDGTVLMSYPFNEKYIGKPVSSILRGWNIPAVFKGEGILSPSGLSYPGSAAYAESSGYPLSIISINDAVPGISREYKVRAYFLILVSALLIINAVILLLLFRHIFASRMKLQELALTDGLTGLPNRRAFETQASAYLSRAARHPEEMCMLMIDIDHFKAVNDTFGHPAGDRILAALAHAMEETFRTSDVLGRMGGEEFAVLLPDSPIYKAHDIAERFRNIVQNILLPDGKPLSVSIGVAAKKDSESLSSLVERADKALYIAKQTGRNRVVSDGHAG